jgi:hypothetical protein
VADKGRKQASRREETHSGITRAQERKGCFQALPAGISTYGEDGVVAGKAENH